MSYRKKMRIKKTPFAISIVFNLLINKIIMSSNVCKANDSPVHNVLNITHHRIYTLCKYPPISSEFVVVVVLFFRWLFAIVCVWLCARYWLLHTRSHSNTHRCVFFIQISSAFDIRCYFNRLYQNFFRFVCVLRSFLHPINLMMVLFFYIFFIRASGDRKSWLQMLMLMLRRT